MPCAIEGLWGLGFRVYSTVLSVAFSVELRERPPGWNHGHFVWSLTLASWDPKYDGPVLCIECI